MNILPLPKQIQVVAALCDGCSIRATERLTEVHRDTIMRLGVRIGEGCMRLHDRLFVDLNVSVLEIDEAWSFIAKKQKRVREEDPAEYGDAYSFIGMDASRKAIVSYVTGKRDGTTTAAFITDLRARILGRPQITSDGWGSYIEAIEAAFGADVDFAQLIKEYEESAFQPKDAAHRYSPGRVKSSEVRIVAGRPDPAKISTSYIERQNLTLRMQTRRCTRLTNAYSKKLRNHAAAVALYVGWYNLVRVHTTTRVTPAMDLGITDHVWSIEELILAALAVDDGEPDAPAPPAPAPEPPPMSVGAINRAESERNARRRARKHIRHPAPREEGRASTVPWLRVIDGGKAA